MPGRVRAVRAAAVHRRRVRVIRRHPRADAVIRPGRAPRAGEQLVLDLPRGKLFSASEGRSIRANDGVEFKGVRWS